MNKFTKTGIGLLELILAITIIGFLSILSVRYFTRVHENTKVARAVDMIYQIKLAGYTWLTGANSKNFSPMTLQQLVENKLLPTKFAATACLGNNPITPWGGKINACHNDATITCSGFIVNPGDFYVNLAELSGNTCANIAAKFTNKNCAICSTDKKTLTIYFPAPKN